jgi:Ser/Thr protein kinase RdoA (MazF antagonist)
MEKRITERYSEGILKAAMSRYGIAQDRISLLDGFESYMYEFDRDDGDFILRIGHSIRRSEDLINGEVDWINYLARGGASVASAISSERGRLVEPIDDGRGGHFLATAFVRARGKHPWEVGWTPELYRAYGELIGRIHALSKSYEPPDPAWRRLEWDHPLMLEVERFVPASETRVLDRYTHVMEHLRRLPRGGESYGLIHQDAHGSNFFVDDEGRITLFDFDDCVYSWYVYDISMVLFYMIVSAEDPAGLTGDFMSHFLPAYVSECSLESRWLDEIPYFLTLREIDLYAVIHRSFDVDSLEDQWCARYMNGRRERIERGTPFVDFDFRSLEVHLTSR